MITLCLFLGSLAAACALAGGLAFSFAFLSGGQHTLLLLAGMLPTAACLFFLPGVFQRETQKRAPMAIQTEAKRLNPMLAWSLAVAVSFGLMGTGMLHDGSVSGRVIAAGWVTTIFSALCAVTAFIGVLMPRLYTPLIYFSLFFIWLIIPIAGMEAYMHAEGVGTQSVYAASYWKWTYVFCATGAVATIRLLILRQNLLRK